MLKKKHRLPIQFFLKRNGFTTKSRFFLLKEFISNQSENRLGVIISKKVSKLATQRNKIKRAIFSFFQLHKSSPQLRDFLIIVMAGAAELGKNEIISELKKLFKTK